MTDSSSSLDGSKESGQHLDRRAALRKAAAAGAIVWSAPTVLTTPASAQVACTPKCAPLVGGQFTATVFTVTCQRNGPVNDLHPYTFRLGNIASTGSACGCGGSVTVALSGATTFTVGPNQWTHGYCPPNDHVGRFGSTSGGAAIYADISCTDRRGRRLCRRCEIAGEFHYCHQIYDCCTGCSNPVPASFVATINIVGNCTAPACC
ncbi:MAG: hypothetical protein V9E89_05515 [Ilumatobacteraceae bacterium]|jgi:hypothetical protein